MNEQTTANTEEIFTDPFEKAAPPPMPEVSGITRIRQSYNRTGGALLIHAAICTAVTFIASMIIAAVLFSKGYSYEAVVTSITKGFGLILITCVSYIIANPLGCLIGLSMTGRKKGTKLMTKPKISKAVILWAIPATMGIQAVSLILQQLFQMLSGTSGISEEIASALSYGNGTASDIVLFLYMVILGPIGEELLYRGMALKNLSCADRRFAVVISALMFGLMHGNVLQFIVGFLIGLFFAYIDIKADSIVPSVILHIINNFIAAFMSIAEIGADENIYDTAVTVYLAAAIVLGITAFFMLRKLLKNSSEDSVSENYPEIYKDAGENGGSLTWKQAAVCPCLWIFAVLYIIAMISAL